MLEVFGTQQTDGSDDSVMDDDGDNGVIPFVHFMFLSSWDFNSSLCSIVYLLPSLLQASFMDEHPRPYAEKSPALGLMLSCHLIESLTNF